jgi:hypothetical protein
VLIASACTSTPPGSGNSQLTLWIAGDSTGERTARQEALDSSYNIAQPGMGFVVRVVQRKTMIEHIRDHLRVHPQPQTLVIIGGGYDIGFNTNPLYAMRSAHEELEALGIDVRFVTEPYPDTVDVQMAASVQAALVAEFPDTIDCEQSGYPIGFDGIHPSQEAFVTYSECIAAALGL